MKHELIERTAHEWVRGNAHRLPQALGRSPFASVFNSSQTAEEITEALIQIAGKMEIAENRCW